MSPGGGAGPSWVIGLGALRHLPTNSWTDSSLSNPEGVRQPCIAAALARIDAQALAKFNIAKQNGVPSS